MKRSLLLVSLFAVSLGLAATYNGCKGQQLQDSSSLSQLSIPETQSHGQTASSSKSELWPLDRIDVALFIVIATCLSLAGGAGIGGGAVLVPVFIMLRGWPTSTAVAMSNVTVLGGSVANFICNVNRHRSNGARTIDWELILMMEPTTIAGALFGAMLNKLLPNYITTYLLTAMLTFMALRLYKKGRQAYAKETQLLKSAKHAARAAAKAQAAADLQEQQQQQQQQDLQPQSATSIISSTSSVLAIKPANSRSGRAAVPAGTAASSLVGSGHALARSFNKSFSASYSRMQSSMIVVADGAAAAAAAGGSPRRWRAAAAGQSGTPRAATAVAAAAGASGTPRAAAAWLSSGRRSIERPQQQQLLGTDGDQAAAAAAGSGSLLDGVAAWLPGMLQIDDSTRLANLREVSTLCQGDTVGDTVEAMVVLPLETSFSSSSSESATSEGGAAADNAAAADVEAGFTAGNSSSRYAYANDDLSQPLLAAAAAAAAAPAGETVHSVDDDVAHGHRDVAAARNSSLVLKGAAAAAVNAGAVVDGTAKLPVHREPCLPIPHLLALLLLSAWVVASDIAQSSTDCGSWQYWVATLSVLLPIAVILLVFRQVLLRKYNHDNLAPGSELPEGQLHWTASTTLLYPMFCSSAGLVAGLFGIGGGVVKGPLMLELGVPPDVAAATSATMIMFTAGSACVVYSRFGQILADYGAVLVAFGFCTTLVSQLLTFALIKLLGRRSVIVFMMVTLMSIACSIMYVQSGFVTRELVLNPSELTHFGRLCPEEPKGLGQMLQQLLRRTGLTA